MRTPLVVAVCMLALPFALHAQQPSVRVEPTDLHGPRPLAQQTAESAVRDYLQSWKSMNAAMMQNRADLLSPDFVGSALEKLTATIHEQTKLGIHVRYVERSHDLQIAFYSPDGLSIQLVDNVEYDEQVLNQDTVLASQPIRTRYIAVLTPSEVRWKVRVFQASHE